MSVRFTYLNAQCIRVIDGDTIECNIMLTFDTRITKKIRLARIDTPEMNEPEGPAAKEAVKNLLQNRRINLHVMGKDSWGRWIAEVIYKDENISDWLLGNQYAVPYHQK